MKRFPTLLTLTSLLLAACSDVRVPNPGTPEPANSTATYTPQSVTTPTPMPPGTWETMIDGRIYDNSSNPIRPIAGASIRYVVVHSYFPELQTGRPNATATDESGKFILKVMVHDTDNIRLEVEARGYRLYEEKLVGVDLFGGKSLEVGLTPVMTGTVRPS